MNKVLRTILLVELDPDIQTIYKYALETIGKLQLYYANTDEEAFTSLIHYTPDLILIDMQLPERESLSLIKEIREIPRLDNIPIILIAPKIQSNEINYYKSFGMFEVIYKPFDPIKLAHEITKKWNLVNEQNKELGKTT